ncbi:TniB family NTP-binding protein [Belnapia rosea]|uniref:AAA domain-containing protein n=1 Tax=Belnapia rosea TaxID=938405 RepID=A0A1G6V6X3_9PROT|nr:TniB family NTP-binding protein [Belnapia rosea]SDD49372.1 AAA domain-containing protein [Belnapia rosea]
MADGLERAHSDTRLIVSSVFYETKRAKKGFELLDMLVEEGRERNYAKALALLGPPRSGKTFIFENWAKLRLGVNGTSNLNPRLPYIEVDQNSNPNKIATTSLDVLGDPDPGYGNEADKTRRVIKELERRAPLFTVFDEVHNLINSDTNRVIESAGRWVTRVLNANVSPLLIIGEPRSIRLFGKNNRQLGGRLLLCEEIEPYDWADEADRQEFREVLHAIDVGLEMAERAGFSDFDKALRIYAFCGGLVGHAANLIATALAFARMRKRPAITLELLAESADGQLLGEDRRANPFRGEAPKDPRPARSE